jgi:hypothetical protein
MIKLLKCKLLLSIIFVCSIAYGEKRFDFEWHETDFFNQNCKIEVEDNVPNNISLWTVTFKDSCQVQWLSNLNGSQSRDYYWTFRSKHGKLM